MRIHQNHIHILNAISCSFFFHKEEIREQPYYLIHRRYDDELGLQPEVEEKDKGAVIWCIV